jgi:O-antigen ligase
MIRYTLLWLSVAGVMTFAWKDWCKALCLLLVMLAVLERPDMPRSMFGIAGLNPFNIALIGIVVAFFATRERVSWNLSPSVTMLFGAYVLMVLIGVVRMLPVRELAFVIGSPPTAASAVFDLVFNTLKWIVPGALLIYGCRDREHFRFALICLLVLYFLLAVQVIRSMPLEYALDGEALQERALRVLPRLIGYHRVDLAMILAGAAWIPLAASYMFTSPLPRLGMMGLSGILFLGLVLTGGRTGLISWAAAGFVLCMVRWRHYLLLAPPAVLVVLVALPGVTDRLMQGVETDSVQGQMVTEVDADTITSGRTKVWPYALAKIRESLWVGYGRRAFVHSGAAVQTYLETDEYFGHPHNAFLEFTLDNGIIGLGLLLAFFGIVLKRSLSLFRDRSDPMAAAVGATGAGLLIAFVAAGLGAQTLYPIQGTVGMWCGIALSLRMWEQRELERRTVRADQPSIQTETSVSLPVALPNAWQVNPVRPAFRSE